MLYYITLLCRHEHNTLSSKKMCIIFLSCEVGTFSSALSVLVTHVIQLWINPLVNPPASLLTMNVWDVICISVRYEEIINPLRRWVRTIHRSIRLIGILGDVRMSWSLSWLQCMNWSAVKGERGRSWHPPYAASEVVPSPVSSPSLPSSLEVLKLLSFYSW
jgi:hypothetical protein